MTDRLERLMTRFQRRALLVLALRYSAVALATAVIVIDVLIALGRVTWTSPWTATAVLVAFVGAGIAAWSRTPTVRQAALTVDARLGLQQRVVTAVQCVGQPDAFSALIIDDAVRRLERASLSSAYPLSVSGAAAIALVVAIGGGIAISRTGRLETREAPVFTGGGASHGAGGQASAGDRPSTETPRRASEPPPPARASAVLRPGETTRARSGTGRGDMSAAQGGVTASDGGRAMTPPGAGALTSAAWAASQGSVAEQRIPAALRPYVRQYFVSIRTGEPTP